MKRDLGNAGTVGEPASIVDSLYTCGKAIVSGPSPARMRQPVEADTGRQRLRRRVPAEQHAAGRHPREPQQGNVAPVAGRHQRRAGAARHPRQGRQRAVAGGPRVIEEGLQAGGLDRVGDAVVGSQQVGDRGPRVGVVDQRLGAKAEELAADELQMGDRLAVEVDRAQPVAPDAAPVDVAGGVLPLRGEQPGRGSRRCGRPGSAPASRTAARPPDGSRPSTLGVQRPSGPFSSTPNGPTTSPPEP